jgi:hypothetical protein
MVNRRKLIGGMAALGAALATRAQVPGRVYRMGYLGYSASSANSKPGDDLPWSAFVLRLRELGFAEGENLVIEQRFAEGSNERRPARSSLTGHKRSSLGWPSG